MVEISASQGQTAIFHGYVSRRRTWFEDFGNWKNREQAFRLTLALLGGQAPVFLRENPRISGKNCIAEGNRFHPAASKASQEDCRSAQPLRRRRRKIAGASKGGRPHMPPVRTMAPEICSLYGVQGGQGLPPVGRGSLRSYSFRSRNPFPILYKCAIL